MTVHVRVLAWRGGEEGVPTNIELLFRNPGPSWEPLGRKIVRFERLHDIYGYIGYLKMLYLLLTILR